MAVRSGAVKGRPDPFARVCRLGQELIAMGAARLPLGANSCGRLSTSRWARSPTSWAARRRERRATGRSSARIAPGPSSRRCQVAPETAPSSIAETARLSAPVPAPCRRLSAPPVVRSFSTTSRAARFARRRRSAAGGRKRPSSPARHASGPARPIARGLSGAAHRRQRARTASSAARTRQGHRFAARRARPCRAALDGTAPAPLLGKV